MCVSFTSLNLNLLDCIARLTRGFQSTTHSLNSNVTIRFIRAVTLFSFKRYHCNTITIQICGTKEEKRLESTPLQRTIQPV